MEQTIGIDEQDSTTPLAYPWYIVSLCMLAYIFSFIDRQVITLLIEPIRADLQISDTQFSLLHGLAFAMLYAIAGIPIARLADSRSRPLIISAGIFVWSFATAACSILFVRNPSSSSCWICTTRTPPSSAACCRRWIYRFARFAKRGIVSEANFRTQTAQRLPHGASLSGGGMADHAGC